MAVCSNRLRFKFRSRTIKVRIRVHLSFKDATFNIDRNRTTSLPTTISSRFVPLKCKSPAALVLTPGALSCSSTRTSSKVCPTSKKSSNRTLHLRNLNKTAKLSKIQILDQAQMGRNANYHRRSKSNKLRMGRQIDNRRSKPTICRFKIKVTSNWHNNFSSSFWRSISLRKFDRCRKLDQFRNSHNHR